MSAIKRNRNVSWAYMLFIFIWNETLECLVRYHPKKKIWKPHKGLELLGMSFGAAENVWMFFSSLFKVLKVFKCLPRSAGSFLCLWSDNFHSHTYINTRPLNCFLGKSVKRSSCWRSNWETMCLVLNGLKKLRLYFHFLSVVVLSSIIWSRTNMPGINEVFRFAVGPLVNRGDLTQTFPSKEDFPLSLFSVILNGRSVGAEDFLLVSVFSCFTFKSIKSPVLSARIVTLPFWRRRLRFCQFIWLQP